MRRVIPVFLFFFAFLFLAAGSAWAQAGEITGTVVDEDDRPLVGVHVTFEVDGVTRGSTSDMDGEYTIENVPAGTHVLEARFVGYDTQVQEVTVAEGETVTVNFTMPETAVGLDEVVVTGTGGPVERRELGHTIGTIDSEVLRELPTRNFSDMLQAREPGMMGLVGGGSTGEGTKIRIRGNASLTQSNEPLVYIDGIRVDRGGGYSGFVWAGGGGQASRLDDINPEAVERVEILKGASAATLYGTEANNGVIQIFTRSGDVGPPQFDFTIDQSVIRMPFDAVPNNTGFPRTQDQANRMSDHFGADLVPWQLHEENFFNDMYQGWGHGQTYNASLGGGAEGITYNITGRFSQENSPYRPELGYDFPAGIENRSANRNQRVQISANLNAFPSERLQFRLVTNYTDSWHTSLQTNNNIYGVIPLAMFSKPEFAHENNPTGTAAFATLFEAMQQRAEQDVHKFNISLGTNYRPSEGLHFDLTTGVDITNQQDMHERPFGWDVQGLTGATPEGQRSVSDRNHIELTLDGRVNWITDITPRLESNFTTGVQGFITREITESMQGSDFPGPGFEVVDAASIQSTFESYLEVINAGVFAQEQIGLDDYIFLTAGARLDANSAFGAEFQGVLYPKASLSVALSDAPFWQPIEPISSVQLRMAIGQSGMQPGAFDALTTYSSLSSVSGAGVVPDNLGNPELRPEVATEIEGGVELGLFQDRLALETTYWDRTVSDALVPRQFPLTGGFMSSQLDNIGEIRGRGVELFVSGTAINIPDFRMDFHAGGDYSWEQVTDMGDAPTIKAGGPYPRYRNFVMEGYAPGAHFTAQLMDVGPNEVPFDLTGDGQPATRDEMLAFLDGNNPFDYSMSDLVGMILLEDTLGDGDPMTNYRGKPWPDWSGSFGTTFHLFENWRLRTNFEYRAGNYYVNNLTAAFRNQNAVIGRNTPKSATTERNYMTGGVDDNHNPQHDPEVRLEAAETFANELAGLDPLSGLNTVERADFIRFRELSLTYEVPAETLAQFGMRNLSFTLSGRNLALWTPYSGVDPEINTYARGAIGTGTEYNFVEGVEAFGIPVPRQFFFTTRFGF